MTQVCHETGKCVSNPFYMISLVIRERQNGRIAFSDLELSLSAEALRNFPIDNLLDDPDKIEDDLFYMIQEVYGTKGGFTNTIQTSLGFFRDSKSKYISRELATSKFPKSSVDLIKNKLWAELVDGEYHLAEWASIHAKKMLKTFG